MIGGYMSLICVKEGARTTFKVIGSVLKTECFPVSARRGQNELNYIVNCTTLYDRHRVERCFVSKSKTTYSVIILIRGLQYHFIGERISSAEFFNNWLNASWNSNWKKRFPYLITTVIHQQRELPPSYRQALRSFSKPKRPKQKSVFESLRDASGVESRSQLIPKCHPPDYLFNQKARPHHPWVSDCYYIPIIAMLLI